MKELPELSSLYFKWKIGIKTGSKLAKDACFELLNILTDEQINKIENLLKTSISIKKINNKIIQHKDYSINSIELSDFDNFQICLYRDEDKLSITAWR